MGARSQDQLRVATIDLLLVVAGFACTAAATILAALD